MMREVDVYTVQISAMTETRTLSAGASCVLATLRLRHLPEDLALSAHLTVHTDLSVYTVPLLLYSGKLHFVSIHRYARYDLRATSRIKCITRTRT